MLVRIVSDIHLEFSYGDMRLNERPEDKDTILVLAGDVGLGSKPHTYLKFFEEKAHRFHKVIYILGNHEHYKGSFSTTFGRVKDNLEKFKNVVVLEKETLVIDKVAFICATMWTDMDKHSPFCMIEAKNSMNDYHTVRHGTNTEPWKRKLLPEDTIADHLNAKHYIFTEIKKQKDKGNKVVVVTHHLPSYQSIPEEFKGDSLNGAYVSDLSEDIIRTKPEVWIHGHTHNSFDYMLADTRVVCNPRGYDRSGLLNLDFDEEFTINV